MPGNSQSRARRRSKSAAAVELPAYRGDIINGTDFTPEARIPDPRRQLEAYRQSAATLNLLRAFATGGYANLSNAHQWMLSFVNDCPQSKRYQELATHLTEALDFMRACGIDPEVHPEIAHDRFLHQPRGAAARLRAGLHAHRFDDRRLVLHQRPHDLDRRPHPAADHAHVEFCRGIKNPLGLKTGPTQKPDEFLKLIDVLDPDNEPGRLTLICRMGADKAADHLPRIVRAVKREGRNVVWSCDPMHGNTITSVSGYKTRPFDQILKEVRTFFQVHAAEGTYAGGVHLEMTGQNVTECTGGARAISEEDLNDRYHTVCDPRLNAEQSLDLAFLLADLLKSERQGKAKPAPAVAAL